MAEDRVLANGEAEGGDRHNQFAGLVAKGGAFVVLRLRKVAQFVALDIACRPSLLQDYGSSQGRNSHRPIRGAITGLSRGLRARMFASIWLLVRQSHGDPHAHVIPS
jgi:hypothetical protein